jgi:hypothetical protein
LLEARLKPVILVTQEAEIWSIVVQSQARQKVKKTPSQPMAGAFVSVIPDRHK